MWITQPVGFLVLKSLAYVKRMYKVSISGMQYIPFLRIHLSSFCHQSICCQYFNDDSDAYHQSDSPTKAPPLSKEITDPVSFSISTFIYVFIRWNDINNQRLSQSPLQAHCAEGDERYSGKSGKMGVMGPSPDLLCLVCPGKEDSRQQQHPSTSSRREHYKKENQLQLLFHASRDLVS